MACCRKYRADVFPKDVNAAVTSAEGSAKKLLLFRRVSAQQHQKLYLRHASDMFENGCGIPLCSECDQQLHRTC